MRRLDKVTRNIAALTAGEADPVLAVLFEAGLTLQQREQAMRDILAVTGVCVVEDLALFREIEG